MGIGLGLIPTAARPSATTAPVNVEKPSFDGILTQGQPAEPNPGAWTGLPSPNFTYAIKRGATTVSTDPAYIWTSADVAAGADAMTVEVTATNDVGPTTETSDPVTIAAPLAISGTPPAALVGTPYTFTPTRTGGHAPYAFALTGTLPSGLSFSTSTGKITGTPLASGTAALSIGVTDGDGLTASLGPFDLVVTSGGGETIPAPFSRVNGPANDPFTAAVANSFQGWTVESASAIDDETPFTVQRAGFDATGAATTYLDTMYVMRKIRQPAPNNASLSASTYALSDYLYVNDAPSGEAVNNATVTSPKPVAVWATLDRLTIPNSIGGSTYPVEVVAAHRNARLGREVACVIFKITDGTTTIPVTVNAVTISPNPYDAMPVQVFALPTTDISSLNDGLITVNAEVYPFLGGATSVRKSADSSNQWEFSPRYYRKNAALVASYPIAYVDPAGNDGTGVVSTNDLTARAAPFATIKGAGNAADAAFGASATGIDNLHIRLNDGTHATTSWGANRRQKISRVIIERSPVSTSRAAAIYSPGASTWNPNLTGSLLTPNGSLLLRDVQITRAGAQALVNAAIVFQLENVGFSNGAQTNTPLTSAQACMTYMNGVTPTASGNQRFTIQTTSRLCMVRGWNGTAGCPSWERLNIVGCIMDQPSQLGLLNNASGPTSNTMVAFNRFTRINTNILWVNNSSATSDGAAALMNEFEWVTTTSGHAMAMSNDGMTYSNIHTIRHHNTFVGWQVMGRENMFYDEGGTPRLSQLGSDIGNIHVAAFTKGDRFRYTNEGNPEGYSSGSPSQRLGNWAFLYGVGCAYNFSQFTTNGALGVDNQAQVLPGRGTAIGVTWNDASQTVRLDPLFVDNKGTKSVLEATGSGSATTAQAGAGDGDYRLQSGSPAKGVIPDPIRSFTLDGVAVGPNDNMGAYSAAA